MKRPFASIVSSSSEKDNDIALKVMCVVDYYMEKHDLYRQINSVPKLMEQIFKFKSYAMFQYYKYALKKTLMRDRPLQCECCEFMGTYETTLEHMVLNHDRHKSARDCHWCGETELANHEATNTLNECYVKYSFRNRLRDDNCPSFIGHVYKLISKIALTLNVQTLRSATFMATMIKTTAIADSIASDDDGISNEMIVSDLMFKRSPKRINLESLEKLFNEAMCYFRVPIKRNHETEVDMMMSRIQNQPICHEFAIGDTMFDEKSIENETANNFTMTTVCTEPTLNSYNYQYPVQKVMPQPSFTLTPPLRPNDVITQPVTELELRNFTNFAGSTINNMYDETIKRRTMCQIQQILLQASADDMHIRFN